MLPPLDPCCCTLLTVKDELLLVLPPELTVTFAFGLGQLDGCTTVLVSAPLGCTTVGQSDGCTTVVVAGVLGFTTRGPLGPLMTLGPLMNH